MAINETEVAQLTQQARTIIHKCVKKNLADGFLFSAGTDTQIIAWEAVKYKPDIPCLTLAFKHGQPKDTQYVKMMVDFLQDISAKIGNIYLLGGTVLQEDGGKYYNTSSLWKNGALIAKYKKISPIDCELKAGVTKGSIPMVVGTDFGQLGLIVCADSFNAELVKKVAELGAEIISLPVAAMGTHPPVKGHPLTEALARNYGVFVLKVGNVSSSMRGGRSAIIAPWGVLGEVTDAPEDSILTAELDMEKLRAYRAKLSKS